MRDFCEEKGVLHPLSKITPSAFGRKQDGVTNLTVLSGSHPQYVTVSLCHLLGEGLQGLHKLLYDGRV